MQDDQTLPIPLDPQADSRLGRPNDQATTPEKMLDRSNEGHAEVPVRDFVLPKEYLTRLVDTVIACKKLNTPFNSQQFLKSLGITEENARVVIADDDFDQCNNYLRNKKLDNTIHKRAYDTLILMKKSRVEENRKTNRVENMTDAQKDAKRRRQKVENMTDAQKDAKRRRNRVENMTDAQKDAKTERNKQRYPRDKKSKSTKSNIN